MRARVLGWICVCVVAGACGRTPLLLLDAGTLTSSGNIGGAGTSGLPVGRPTVPPSTVPPNIIPPPPPGTVPGKRPNMPGNSCDKFTIVTCGCPDGVNTGQQTTCYDATTGASMTTGCEYCPPVPMTSPLACESSLPIPLSHECGKELCACNPNITQTCSDSCWALLGCVITQCNSDGNDLSCISSQCSSSLSAASELQKVFSNSMCLISLKGCITSTSSCGNGVVDTGESCDGSDLNGYTCESFGLRSGKLACSPDCRGFDTSNCAFGSCGDGKIEQSEACDGNDLGGASCESLGFTGGQLNCKGCAFDTSGCARCGNGAIDPGESCDGDNLNGLSCQSLGYTGGSLVCTSCKPDTSGCAACGNGKVEPGENCESMQLGGQSCASLGLGDGTLACDPSVCLFDTSGCSKNTAVCGNGVAERGEACDGKDLANLDCTQLGFGGGSLQCNPMTCRFDSSGCTSSISTSECSSCGRTNCGDQIKTCSEMPQCHGGLDCLANMCGTNPDLNCATSCFGSTDPALAALSMFACIVDHCGSQCLGEF